MAVSECGRPEITWEHEDYPEWDGAGTIEEAYSALLGDGRSVTVYRCGAEWAWGDDYGNSEGPYQSREEAEDAALAEGTH